MGIFYNLQSVILVPSWALGCNYMDNAFYHTLHSDVKTVLYKGLTLQPYDVACGHYKIIGGLPTVSKSTIYNYDYDTRAHPL